MDDTASRQTVDLSDYPELVVIYLGMRVQAPRGLLTLLRFGRRIARAVDAEPDGLLHHEALTYSLFPPHLGMRQYWVNFESLERWARTPPHKDWWETFVSDPAGTAFWHEAYAMQGGIDAVYLNVDPPTGLLHWGPSAPARGPFYAARDRFDRDGEPERPSAVSEAELYEDDT